MKIVIEISEDVYTRLFDNGIETSFEDIEAIDIAIRVGTILDEERKPVIDKVLEIVDELNNTKALVAKTPLGKYLHDTLANEIKTAVEELKGDEQK